MEIKNRVELGKLDGDYVVEWVVSLIQTARIGRLKLGDRKIMVG